MHAVPQQNMGYSVGGLRLSIMSIEPKPLLGGVSNPSCQLTFPDILNFLEQAVSEVFQKMEERSGMHKKEVYQCFLSTKGGPGS